MTGKASPPTVWVVERWWGRAEERENEVFICGGETAAKRFVTSWLKEHEGQFRPAIHLEEWSRQRPPKNGQPKLFGLQILVYGAQGECFMIWREAVRK